MEFRYREFDYRNLAKIVELIQPIIDKMIKKISNQRGIKHKDLILLMALETLIYNLPMSNLSLISILANIIDNISSENSYSGTLDWSKRNEMLKGKS